MPDYRELDKIYKKYDWSTKVYGTQHEEFPMNMPKPLGGMMRITQYVDANLYFDLVSGRACTGILTFLNQTLVDWYSKKQKVLLLQLPLVQNLLLPKQQLNDPKT